MISQEQFDAIPLEKKVIAAKKFYLDMVNSKSGDEQTSYEIQNNAMAGWIIAALDQLVTELRAVQAQQAAFQEEVDK